MSARFSGESQKKIVTDLRGSACHIVMVLPRQLVLWTLLLPLES